MEITYKTEDPEEIDRRVGSIRRFIEQNDQFSARVNAGIQQLEQGETHITPGLLDDLARKGANAEMSALLNAQQSKFLSGDIDAEVFLSNITNHAMNRVLRNNGGAGRSSGQITNIMKDYEIQAWTKLLDEIVNGWY